MKTQLFILTIVVALTKTSCDLVGDLKSEKTVPAKNLITSILEKVLNMLLSNSTSIQIPLIPLGPENGVLENVRIDLNDTELYPVEGEGSFSIKNLTLTFGRLAISGLYKRSWVLRGLEVTQTGNFSVDLEDVSFFTGVTIKLNVNELIITDFPGFDFELQNSKVFFELLLGDNPIGNLLNDVLGYGFPSFVEATKGEFINNYGDDLADFLNPILNCFKSHPLNPLECLQ